MHKPRRLLRDCTVLVRFQAVFEEELKSAGIEDPLVGPMLLPDYTTDMVGGKQWAAHYEGTLR
jgi:hypothetical protein